jgi:hypothetical protein
MRISESKRPRIADGVLQKRNRTFAANQPEAPLDSPMRQELHTFLRKVANSPLKVKALHVFLLQSGVCLSSAQLSERIGESVERIREALQQLNDEGALTFCACFGYGDLCLMNPNYQTTAMKHDLALLLRALRVEPAQVWHFFELPDHLK